MNAVQTAYCYMMPLMSSLDEEVRELERVEDLSTAASVSVDNPTWRLYQQIGKQSGE